VAGVLDALGHPTNWTYNDRGQPLVTTLSTDPSDGNRHTITNVYNADGTLQSKTDQLGHMTQYTYDDYRRLKSVTPPVRGAGDNGTYTTYYYYGANAWDGIADYRLTDSNVTWIKPPSIPISKKINTDYDDNRRKRSVTVAATMSDAATTSYTYDAAGNVTWITDPMGRWLNASYDERDRPSSVNDFGRTTTFTYDTAGRKTEIERPDGQVITNVSFDAMNRVLQQNVTQSPDPTAITKYEYYPYGPVALVHTMKDPRLVTLNNGEQYEYLYDTMGRKTWVTYPHDSGVQTTEHFTYDDAGRLDTFKNRQGNTQTFTYDALNRITGFSWNDTPRTPSVSFTYDAASRLTEIDNANANISRSYYNDNLLHMETQSLSAAGGVDNRHVTYTYDTDGNRATLAIPGYTFDYVYTNRNQVKFIDNDATGAHQAYYVYDLRGNVTLRNAYSSPIIASNYNYDGYGRVTSIGHALNGTTRTFSYGYDNSSDNRLWTKRGMTSTSSENNKGEAFSYDLADQAIAFQLNVANPQNASQPLPRNIIYDSNGNRTNFQAVQYGAADNLNQYTTRTGGTTAAYDLKGNMTTSLDGSTYTYDAQNRLLTANKNAVSITFKYDGLNRQVSRTVSGTTTYSTWDGWNLVEEYTNNPSLVIQARYLYGPTGLVKELQNNRYYCQDGSGSTALLADSTAHLLEWYRYDLQGNPFFYNPNDTQRNPNQSGYNVRHLFTGQQWYSDIGLYDLRNRFYSPDIGRFLQPDPIGFRGGNNLYGYVKNNPVTRSDPFGLQVGNPAEKGNENTYTYEHQYVSAPPIPDPSNISRTGFLPGSFSGGPAVYEFGGHLVGDKYVHDYNPFPRPENDQPSVEHPPPSSVPPQNPPSPADTVLTITVMTVIENGPFAGLKSYQWATANVLGEITGQGGDVGRTYNYLHGTYDKGYGQFRARSSAASSGAVRPVFNVTMQGHAWSADLPEKMAIDYQLITQVNLISRTVTLVGMHDAYPSYTVTVNGATLDYFHEHFIGDLAGPMDVPFVGGGGW
jgi:RHS repeat-associated protein